MHLGDQLPVSVMKEAPPGAGPSSVALTARLQGMAQMCGMWRVTEFGCLVLDCYGGNG